MSAHANLNISDTLTIEEFWAAYEKRIGKMTIKEWESSERNGINNIMNLALIDLIHTEALVLDLRFNHGGQDQVALDIISYFNTKKQISFTKKARRSNGSYTPAQEIYLEASNAAYTKPVILLTSQQTASAAEILVLSSLSLPNITRLGSPTRGIFSDELTKRLPNGWSFGLSNEVYLDLKGINYESLGISPNLELDYPSDQQTFLQGISEATTEDFNLILNAINPMIEESLKN